jgi:hypothetical protein
VAGGVPTGYPPPAPAGYPTPGDSGSGHVPCDSTQHSSCSTVMRQFVAVPGTWDMGPWGIKGLMWKRLFMPHFMPT